MGGLPLLALKSRTLRKVTFWSDASGTGAGRLAVRPTARTVISAAKPMFPGRAPSTPPSHRRRSRPRHPPASHPPHAEGADASTELVGELQRLAAMHRAGELTDDEFATAKQRLLRAT